MRKNSLYIISTILICLTLSCNSNGNHARENKLAETSNFTTINDSTWSEKIYDLNNVSMDLIKSDFHYTLKINKNGKIKTINFDKEGIDTKTPEIEWANDRFVSITPWWSLSFSTRLFIDLENPDNFIYIDKDVRLTDEKSNSVVYVDILSDNSIVFKLENLVSRKQKTIALPFDKQKDDYLLYDDMRIENNELVITTPWGKETRSGVLR